MNSVIIEIIDEKAIAELKEMELKKLIKFRKSESVIEPPSKRFWGKISKETAEALHKHVEESRAEWDRF